MEMYFEESESFKAMVKTLEGLTASAKKERKFLFARVFYDKNNEKLVATNGRGLIAFNFNMDIPGGMYEISNGALIFKQSERDFPDYTRVMPDNYKDERIYDQLNKASSYGLLNTYAGFIGVLLDDVQTKLFAPICKKIENFGRTENKTSFCFDGPGFRGVIMGCQISGLNCE